MKERTVCCLTYHRRIGYEMIILWLNQAHLATLRRVKSVLLSQEVNCYPAPTILWLLSNTSAFICGLICLSAEYKADIFYQRGSVPVSRFAFLPSGCFTRFPKYCFRIFGKKQLAAALWQLCILDWILRKQLLTNQQSPDIPGRPGSKILPKLRQNNGLINFGNTLIKMWCRAN